MEYLELSKKRFSCRKFTEQPVEKEKIDKLIEAAISAPTAKNFQPFHIWLITKEEDIEKVNGTNPFRFGAKAMLVVGGDAKTAWVRPYDGRNFQDVDASIVATHIMMEAEDLGLGTTWIGYFDADKMKEEFPKMKGYDLIAIFPIGYPAKDDPKCGPIPMHFTRKSREELVTEL